MSNDAENTGLNMNVEIAPISLRVLFKLPKIVLVFLLANSLSGCLAYFLIDSKDEYDNSQGRADFSIIKGGDSVQLAFLDGKRISSVAHLVVGKGYKSVKVKPASHSIKAVIAGKDANITGVTYESGHVYEIQTYQAGQSIYYWLTDLTTQKVVWGERFGTDTIKSK